MPDARLLAVITALMLVATVPRAQADFSLDQLKALEQLILARDGTALRRYLAANPQMLRGDDPLARELRGLQSCLYGSGVDCFSAAATPSASTGEPTPAPTPEPIY